MLGLTPWKKNGNSGSMATIPAAVTPLRWDGDRLFDRFWDDFFAPGHSGASGGIRIDLSETDEEVVVRAEVPGIEPSALDVQLTGELLHLSVEKSDERESKSGSKLYSERQYGAFRRSIQLPCPVDPDAVDAVLENGVVTITLKKIEAMRPKRIRIKAS